MLSSWLFIPGNNKKHIQKAQDLSADAIIFDLEDSVTMDEKENARLQLSHALKSIKEKYCYVRVNALDTDEFLDDVNKVVATGLSGIVLPKVNRQEDITIADYIIGKLENKRDIVPGSIKLVPIIETAEGLINAYDIAKACHRLERFAFGVEDFMLEMNIQPADDESELLYARSQLVIASRAADIAAPVDSIYSDFKNVEGLKKSAERGKRLGFGGKLLIHPAQIETVNHIFAPTTEDLEEAKEIVEAYEKSIKNGEGAIQVNGKMIDVPVAERARKLLLSMEEKNK